MRMPFSLFLALKYLKPKRSYFSIITIISILGVLLGVAVLIIVLSVMNGFDELWREKILGFNAHLTISEPGGGLDGVEEMLAKIEADPGVRAAAPYIEFPVVLQSGGRLFTPLLRGVDPAREPRVSEIPREIARGAFCTGAGEAVIGSDLARRLGLDVGDRIYVSSPQSYLMKDEIRLPEELTIAGVFDVGMWEYDMGYVICILDTAREVFGMEEEASAIRVMTFDPYRAREIGWRLQAELGPGARVDTWMEQNRQLFSALRVEKNMMFFLLIFITIVAAFGITNTLITVAVQKTKEIGLLKAIGFGSGRIMRIFFWLGWIEGMIGTAAGIGAGWLALRYRNDLMQWLSATFHWELFPKELYRLSEIPSRTSPVDVAVVAVCVITICTLAGLVPAYRASRLDPVEALRHE